MSGVFEKVVSNKGTIDMKTEFVRPDKVSGCKWHLGADPSSSPHTKVNVLVLLPVLHLTILRDNFVFPNLSLFVFSEPRPKILPSILSAIGQTPLVRLNNIPKSLGIRCEMRKQPISH